MLEIQRIRSEKETIINQLKKVRNIDISKTINDIFHLDEKKRTTQQKLDSCSANMNSISVNIGEQFKEGNIDKANQLKQETGQIKEKIKKLKADFVNLENDLIQLLYEIPNVPHQNVPSGSNENDNEIVFQENILLSNYSSFLPHWELCKKYDLIDFELGVKITGAGFPVYKGKGAILQRALIQFFLNPLEQLIQQVLLFLLCLKKMIDDFAKVLFLQFATIVELDYIHYLILNLQATQPNHPPLLDHYC